MRDAADTLPPEVDALFRRLDTNKDGGVSRAELMKAVRTPD